MPGRASTQDDMALPKQRSEALPWMPPLQAHICHNVSFPLRKGWKNFFTRGLAILQDAASPSASTYVLIIPRIQPRKDPMLRILDQKTFRSPEIANRRKDESNAGKTHLIAVRVHVEGTLYAEAVLLKGREGSVQGIMIQAQRVISLTTARRSLADDRPPTFPGIDILHLHRILWVGKEDLYIPTYLNIHHRRQASAIRSLTPG